jgi:hypothetical protein
MQPVDHVHFGERLLRTARAASAIEDLLDRRVWAPAIAFLEARERAEEARGHADVRGLEPQVVS